MSCSLSYYGVNWTLDWTSLFLYSSACNLFQGCGQTSCNGLLSLYPFVFLGGRRKNDRKICGSLWLAFLKYVSMASKMNEAVSHSQGWDVNTKWLFFYFLLIVPNIVCGKIILGDLLLFQNDIRRCKKCENNKKQGIFGASTPLQ